MYQTPEQLIALNKTNVEAALKLANVTMQGIERLVDLQLQVAKSAFAESANSARAIAGAKDVQELANLRAGIAQPSFEKATAVAREFYSVAASTQVEFNKLFETQAAEFNRNMIAALDKAAKNAPAGTEFAITAIKSAVAAANSAYDNLAKAAKQFADATEANVTAAVQPTARKKAA